MPAEPEPENFVLPNCQNAPFALPATHASRMSQWADSWAQQFRNDSKIFTSEISPNLPIISLLEEMADAESIRLPKSGN